MGINEGIATVVGALIGLAGTISTALRSRARQRTFLLFRLRGG